MLYYFNALSTPALPESMLCIMRRGVCVTLCPSGTCRSPRSTGRKGEYFQSFCPFFCVIMRAESPEPSAHVKWWIKLICLNKMFCPPSLSQGDIGLQGDKGEKVCAFYCLTGPAARFLSFSLAYVFVCVGEWLRNQQRSSLRKFSSEPCVFMNTHNVNELCCWWVAQPKKSQRARTAWG